MRSVAFQMRCVYATEKLYHNNFPLWAAAAAAAAAIEKRMRYIFFILPFFIINFPFYLYIQYFFFSTFCFSCCCFALHFLFRVYEKYVLFPTLHYYYYDDDDDVVFDDILARIASNVRWIHTHLPASGWLCALHFTLTQLSMWMHFFALINWQSFFAFLAYLFFGVSLCSMILFLV